jgi:enoyl-CoA hydratase/carnithine racemase
MGGGVGISIHGSHRVAGDRFSFAMPEVGIGFFPDVGATWFLPRMPGELGTWCALTGDRLKSADAVAAGIATHHVRSERFADLADALCGNVSVDAVLGAFAEPAGQGTAVSRADRSACSPATAWRIFWPGSRRKPDEWAVKTAAAIRTKSPLSLKIALAQVRRGRDWSFGDCMRAEFRIVSRIVYGHDFYEGVRAVIVDKDNVPRWQPAGLADAADADVERHFAYARRGRAAAAMTDQNGVLPPPSNKRQPVWTRRLVLFLRIMATVSLIKGLHHWSLVLGIGDGDGSTFEQAGTPWQAATVFFAVIDLVAAVGIWLAAAWGGVVWLHRRDLDGGNRAVLPAGLWRGGCGSRFPEFIAIAIYIALALLAGRERPD